MADNNFLKWLSGRGWLIFSGGNSIGSPVRAEALSKAKDYGIVAYISTAADSGDALMDDMEDLGARSGYFIDLDFEAPEDVKQELETASFIVIEIGGSVDDLYNKLKGAAVEGILEAYERGAVVLIEGLAANIFGRWIISDNGELLAGLDWVKDSFIEPESGGIEDSRAVRAVLEEIPEAIAINIGSGSALALGSGGQVELLGAKEVTISLGTKYL